VEALGSTLRSHRALIEDDVPEGKRTFVVEDLTTGGQSTIRFAIAPRNAGANVNHAFVVFFHGVTCGHHERGHRRVPGRP
jgi:orotate phosphoribosyltransferase